MAKLNGISDKGIERLSRTAQYRPSQDLDEAAERTHTLCTNSYFRCLEQEIQGMLENHEFTVADTNKIRKMVEDLFDNVPVDTGIGPM